MNFLEGRLIRDRGLAFQDGAVRISLPASYERPLAGLVDRPMILGIRPESLSEAGPEQAGEGQIPATVEVVEPMGSEVLLYATTGRSQLVSRIPADRMPAIGEQVRLSFDLSRAHLFDGESEVALSVQGS
jgi:multiple sugar transport system ATP-binding protein